MEKEKYHVSSTHIWQPSAHPRSSTINIKIRRQMPTVSLPRRSTYSAASSKISRLMLFAGLTDLERIFIRSQYTRIISSTADKQQFTRCKPRHAARQAGTPSPWPPPPDCLHPLAPACHWSAIGQRYLMNMQIMISVVHSVLDASSDGRIQLNWIESDTIDKCNKTKRWSYNICDSDKIISLNLVNQLKDLGILIDQRLTSRERLHNKINQAFAMICTSKRNFKYLNIATSVSSHKSTVKSHFNYCNSVWTSYKIADIEALGSKRATKMLPELKCLHYPQLIFVYY